MLQVVVMGHDGVVVNSNVEIYDAVCNLCVGHVSFPSHAVPSFLKFLEFFRWPGDKWFVDSGFDFPPAMIRETLRPAPDRAELFLAVPPMIRLLVEKSKLAIVMVSAGDQARIERQLKKGRIHQYFELVFGGEDNKVTAIEDLCSFYGLEPQALAYVGSLPSEMEQACEAGAIAIAFTDDCPAMEGILTRAGAQHCVSDHEQLGNLLLELACP